MSLVQFAKACAERGLPAATCTKRRSAAGGYEFVARKGDRTMIYHLEWGWARTSH